jgi:cellulose synthase (UDP-forming)
MPRDLTGKVGGYAALFVGVVLLFAMATVPLSIGQQATVGVSTAIIFLIANRFTDKRVTLFLSILSLAMSLRYIYWRATETLTFQTIPQMLLGSLLVIAEFYAVVVLVIGYFQTAMPLNRKPVPLPADQAEWPTIDVYIPTYNESMAVVRATILGCRMLDWPADKLRVYLLDDGKRAEFKKFAAECGIGYITRTNNFHAKAGNLNHAMSVTKGEFIAIFDCDHIPVRAFLQLTVGWLVREKKLAMVQTPHHFYSPDPFQRNLAAGTRVPPEGNMFYGLLQDGNDYWDATFFCGSCAVIRREALNSIGGFATETVTEDAHTMLKLHRRGWSSAFLALPLAAGLATERLILHLGQRIRWARGMLQIFRLDNPLLGPGLNIGQRLCYLNAMVHFFFGIPRVVFLLSPLAYLLLFQNMIAASPFAIVAYALPHIFHSVATSSRIQRNWRHSFWSEIYETVLAMFLVRVTLVTLISPRRGKFNVTEKGGVLARGYFDLRAVYPNIILGLFLILGMARGVYSMSFQTTTTLVFQALLLNTIWAGISLLIILAALAVGREKQQLRAHARVRVKLPIIVHLADGRVLTGEMQNISQSGARAVIERPEDVPEGSDMLLEVPLPSGAALIPSRILRWQARDMLMNFEPKTLADESAVIQCVFGRADAWLDWSDYPKDQPLVSLWRVLVSIGGLFRPPDLQMATPAEREASEAAVRAALARKNVGLSANQPQPEAGELIEEDDELSVRQIATAAVVAMLLVLLPIAAQAQSASGQTTIVRPMPQSLAPTDQSGPGSVPLPTIGIPSEPGSGTPPGVAPNQAAAAGAGSADASAAVASGVVEQDAFTLKQLGATSQIALRGTSPLQGVEFGIRGDEVVTNATLTLTGAMSPSLLPDLSNITVTLNDQFVGTIPVNPSQPNFSVTLPVNPVFFQSANHINFRLTGAYTRNCNDMLSGLIWGTVYNSSSLSMTLQHLPPQRDLSQLPLPFFDKHDNRALLLPFVLPANADDDTLKAAAITASWFGELADFRGASFPVSTTPPHGDAVMIVSNGNGGAIPGLPPIQGPGIAIVPNPSDPDGSILVISGRSGAEAAQAATVLSLGHRTLGGTAATVDPPVVPARVPYDAPAWIPQDRAVRLGELTDARNLNGVGYDNMISVAFRTSPDLYTWRQRGFPLNVAFRAPPGPIENLQVSRLDIGINGIYLNTTPLAGAVSYAWWRDWIPVFGAVGPYHKAYIPPYDVFGDNALQFFFDTRPLDRGACGATPQDPQMGIDPNSTISLARGYHFAEMPNLAYFVSAGFPFSRMADLSQTSVVLPDSPDSGELSAFLRLMGRFGYMTGYPVLQVAVARPGEETALQSRDILVIGTVAHLGSLSDILRNVPVTVDNGQLGVKIGQDLGTIFRVFSNRQATDRRKAAAALTASTTQDTAFLTGGESPWTHGKSVVALLAGTPQGLDNVISSFRDPTLNPLIQGDFSIVSAKQISSYRIARTYSVGWLPFWLLPSWWLRGSPGTIVVVMIIGCVILTIALHAALSSRARGRLGSKGDH